MRALLVMAMCALGCGGVAPLDVQDPRLTPDARRRVADAEDAPVVARARLAAAEDEASSLERWAESMRGGGGVGGATQALVEMADARVAHARGEVEVKRAALTLALARRTLTYAETAIRHDLAIYPLEALRAAVDSARSQMLAVRSEQLARSNRLEQRVDAWWTAFQGHVRGGGDTRGLWTDTPR
jgi:hypothetical protein